jgi:succinate--hydroxymethylglutarate CoA-transferase
VHEIASLHPEGIDLLRLVGPPVGFSQTPPTVRTPPPDLGEHTDEILRERLGLHDAEIEMDRNSGAI